MATFQNNVVDVDLIIEAGSTDLETGNYTDAVIVDGNFLMVSDRYLTFASASEMLDAGWLETSDAYIMASLAFQGNFAPPYITIGRRDLTNMQVTLAGAATGAVYNIELQDTTGTSTTFSATVDGTTITNVTQAATTLVTAIEADSTFAPLVTATSSAGVITLVGVGGFDIAVSATKGTITLAKTYAQTMTEALEDINDAYNGWYWIGATSHADLDIQNGIKWAASNDRMFMWSTQDSDLLSASTIANTMAYWANANSYMNSNVAYCSTADTTWFEGAMIGGIANADAGSTTLNGKKFVGAVVETGLTTTQKTLLFKYNVGFYEKQRGLKFYRDAGTGAGYFVDLVHCAHWSKGNLGASLTELLWNESNAGSKVLLGDDEGKLKVKQYVYKNVVNPLVRNKAIYGDSDGIVNDTDEGTQYDYRPYLYLPSKSAISSTNLANRIWDGCKLTLHYRAGTHMINITLYVVEDTD